MINSPLREVWPEFVPTPGIPSYILEDISSYHCEPYANAKKYVILNTSIKFEIKGINTIGMIRTANS